MDVNAIFTAFNSDVDTLALDLGSDYDSEYSEEETIFWYIQKHCLDFLRIAGVTRYLIKGYNKRDLKLKRAWGKHSERYFNFGDLIADNFMDTDMYVEYMAIHTREYLQAAIDFLSDARGSLKRTPRNLLRAIYRKVENKFELLDSLWENTNNNVLVEAFYIESAIEGNREVFDKLLTLEQKNTRSLISNVTERAKDETWIVPLFTTYLGSVYSYVESILNLRPDMIALGLKAVIIHQGSTLENFFCQMLISTSVTVSLWQGFYLAGLDIEVMRLALSQSPIPTLNTWLNNAQESV